MAVRDADLRQREFENYHQLIEDLVTGAGGKSASQVARIFELRNYPDYADVSIRILQGLREDWADEPKGRLQSEIALTLKKLERINKVS